jgi:hypothetical protein
MSNRNCSGGAVQSFAAGETVADVSHARLLSKSAGSEHRWRGGPVGDALGEAGGGRVYAPGVGPPVPCGQVLLEVGCGPVRVTGQDICRAKGHFALFGVPSGRMAGGRDVCRAKGHFALFGVPSGRMAVGRGVCRAKGHFALFAVPSGGVAGGRDVRRAKGHFALFGVPSGGVAGGRDVRRAKWHFALFGVPSVQAGRAVSKFIRPDGAYEKKTSG